MGDRFENGKTDWHNWMRDTMKIDPSDKRTIEIVWACIVEANRSFVAGHCSQCAKNSEQQVQPDNGYVCNRSGSCAKGQSGKCYSGLDCPDKAVAG